MQIVKLKKKFYRLSDNEDDENLNIVFKIYI